MDKSILRSTGLPVLLLAGLALIALNYWDWLAPFVASSWPLLAGIALVLAALAWKALAERKERGSGGRVRDGSFDTAPEGGPGPGRYPVGVPGIIFAVAFLAGSTFLILYVMLAIWPRPTAASIPAQSTTPANIAVVPAAGDSTLTQADSAQIQPAAETRVLRCDNRVIQARLISTDGLLDPSCVTVFANQKVLYAEQRLLLITLLAGALGGLLHGLKSITWYVGNRSLYGSWLATYVMMPFTGAAVAFVFYVVVRGGFFSPQASFQETSPFGFAALATLVGLFSGQAMLKLKLVAETLLTKTEQGADHVGPAKARTAITLEPSSFKVGQTPALLKVKGAGFTEHHKVEVGGKVLEPDPAQRTEKELVVNLPGAVMAKEGVRQVVVVDTAGERVSKTAELTIEPAGP